MWQYSDQVATTTIPYMLYEQETDTRQTNRLHYTRGTPSTHGSDLYWLHSPQPAA